MVSLLLLFEPVWVPLYLVLEWPVVVLKAGSLSPQAVALLAGVLDGQLVFMHVSMLFYFLM